MATTILGIRHHGVGSAKQVLARLAELKPDLIMVEGPPEISDALKYIGHKELEPPVSIMVYDTSNPKLSSFYPFTKFSPEWVAAKYANDNSIPIRSMDMPAAISFHQKNSTVPIEMEEKPIVAEENSIEQVELTEAVAKELLEQYVPQDPLLQLAELSGYKDTETWWDYYFERVPINTDAASHFEAVQLGMETLRKAEEKPNLENEQREAYMRSQIRQAQNEMYQNIVVVCGAWHQPALLHIDQYDKQDVKTLKAIPKSKLKIAASWIPWTNERLSMFSGYGAGITSPGWYAHLWEAKEDYAIDWLIKVARTFRKKQVDISSAHIIETVRLAESLAALRNKSTVTLSELNEATLAVMCMGDGILLQLIQKALIVHPQMGKVPSDIPKLPIQENFDTIVKSLRLATQPYDKQLDFDLRKDNDLQKSIFLHRLLLLQITWGKKVANRTKGTFKESWILCWQPEIIVQLIDKAYLGNTVEIAATAYINEQAANNNSIAELAQLIAEIIPAELYASLDAVLTKIQDLTTIAIDVQDLMFAIAPLMEVARYGNVRKTDATVITYIIENLIVKINIGLPNACYGLNEDQSEKMFSLISSVNENIKLFNNEALLTEWITMLQKLHQKTTIHPLIIGCVSRLLLDANVFTDAAAETMMSYFLANTQPPADVAFWLQGFLKNSGMLLLYDNRLWNLLYQWVAQLGEEVFMDLLPFLRKTFSAFEFAERRQIGEKAKKGYTAILPIDAANDESKFDYTKANQIIPTLAMLMDLK
jgi:Family of unknown function (DUF5682)